MSIRITSSSEITSEIEPKQTTTNDSASSLTNSTEIATTQNQKVDDEIAELPSSAPPKAKKLSVGALRDCFPSKREIFKPKPVDIKATTITTTNAATTNNNSSHDEALALSNLIRADFIYVKKASEDLKEYKDQVNRQIEDAWKKFEKLKEGESHKDLREIKKTVTKLKLQIPSKYKSHSDENDPHRNQRSNGMAKSKGVVTDEMLDKMPQLYKKTAFEQSSAFKDIEALYDGLDIELKLCLLCFSVFPENAIIKKRLMVYWWIGERFVPPIPRNEETREAIARGKRTEEFACEFFNQLMEKGFIEPVYKKRGHRVGSCRMNPLIRSAVIMLAERAKFFDFDPKGNPTDDFSSSFRACLVGKGLTNIQDLDKLHMLFNVNEAILEFKPEWFLKMKNVNVLCLGRWQDSAAHHIEVEETTFLDGLEGMNHLRLFSLQGVSRITELPQSISQLTNLTVLDLRACHSLEVIPDGIGLLKSLTHLDMSECYLLDRMPLGLSSLLELQVLEGFVVVDVPGKNSCTLDDLAKLPKLRKLSIYTGLKDFPTDTHLNALQQLQVLCKLIIEWGGGASQVKPDDKGDKKKDSSLAERTRAPARKARSRGSLTRSYALKFPLLPSQLQKLDLKCFPGRSTPSWLMPANLKGLKKLYIRGGKFSDLGQFQELDDWGGHVPLVKDKWKVQVLRLKYLSELEMDWRELQELFPDLIYLEKVQCPKLAFFPCDESGIWMNKAKLKQLQDMHHEFGQSFS